MTQQSTSRNQRSKRRNVAVLLVKFLNNSIYYRIPDDREYVPAMHWLQLAMLEEPIATLDYGMDWIKFF